MKKCLFAIMNKKMILATVLAVGTMTPGCAQGNRQLAPNDTLQPVRNLGDGRVVFSIYAPEAKQVGILGDVVTWDYPVDFQKAANGVWSATIPNVKDGVYRLSLIHI